MDGLCQPPLGNVGPGLVWPPGPAENVSDSLSAGGALGLLVSLTAGVCWTGSLSSTPG